MYKAAMLSVSMTFLQYFTQRDYSRCAKTIKNQWASVKHNMYLKQRTKKQLHISAFN
jgi:hypothetical protein